MGGEGRVGEIPPLAAYVVEHFRGTYRDAICLFAVEYGTRLGCRS